MTTPLRVLGASSLAVVLSAAPAVAAGQAGSLVDAIQSRNHQALHVLLDRHAGVNTRSADGTTPLHWAARVDDVESVRLLLHAGAEVNVANRYGVTPLMLAATNGSVAVVDALLQAGADATAALPEGETVLMTAARTGQPAVVEALIKHGANVNAKESWLGETALMWAAAENHADVVRALARCGADLNVHSAPTAYARRTGGQTVLPRGGFTALMYAARQNAVDAGRALMESGADADQVDADGMTSLVVSIINAHYDFAAMLLENGADPNIADVTGMTPLYAAVDMNTLQFMHGRPPSRPSGQMTAVDLVKQLLAYGAAPDSALKTTLLQRHNTAGNRYLGEGTTPLMRAAKSGDVVLMKLLLDAGANPHLRQKNGNTLLLLAAGFGRKFDQNADALEYETATEADLLRGTEFCVQQLGLDVNAVNDAGETPMHVAAGESIVRFLAAHGGRLDIKNGAGQLPYDVAILRKDRTGRQLLAGTLVAFRDLNAPHVLEVSARPPEALHFVDEGNANAAPVKSAKSAKSTDDSQ
ncbi:MAG TPA: ankyrin repeat domain-containing protein [Vicinamibacterales bacterium]|nr:ankyrin repeat domain-containing protein [Vicinamibacterales bacterium]